MLKTIRFEYFDNEDKLMEIEELTFTYKKDGSFRKGSTHFIKKYIEYVSNGGKAAMRVKDEGRNTFFKY
jgi:hypothetical protein